MTTRTESAIIGDLVTKQNNTKEEILFVHNIHKNTKDYSSPTVAYPRIDSNNIKDHNRSWSEKLPLDSNPKKSFYGFAIAQKVDFVKNEKETKRILPLMSPLWVSPGQHAYALSLHYEYPDGSDSGHTVGFFNSNGGFGKRRPGMRFFDPNIGSWEFKKPEEGMNFLLMIGWKTLRQIRWQLIRVKNLKERGNLHFSDLLVLHRINRRTRAVVFK